MDKSGTLEYINGLHCQLFDQLYFLWNCFMWFDQLHLIDKLQKWFTIFNQHYLLITFRWSLIIGEGQAVWWICHYSENLQRNFIYYQISSFLGCHLVHIQIWETFCWRWNHPSSTQNSVQEHWLNDDVSVLISALYDAWNFEDSDFSSF